MLDARQLDDGTVLEADLCVIGAGAAGITIARHLAGSSLSVLLLESGGREPDPATQALAGGAVVGEPLYGANVEPRDVVDTRLRYLGGSTNHWAGTCRPLDPIDFEVRPWLEFSGWPFDLDELIPWYEAAQHVCKLGPFHYDWEWWAENESLGPPLVATERIGSHVLQIAFPAPFGEFYGDELAAAPNVEICLWANVVELVSNPDGDRVEEASIVTLEGGRLSAVADRFVVACGGIDNPRLLLASNGSDPRGLGNANGLVGRFFNEHLQVAAGFASLTDSGDEMALHRGFTLPVGPDDRDVGVRGALALSGDAQRSEELIGLQMQPIVGAPGGAEVPRQESGVGAADVEALLVEELGHPSGGVAHIQALAEQELNYDSRVLLTDEVDGAGMPVVAVDWRHTEMDRRSIRTGLEILAEDLGRAGAGRLQIVPGGVRFSEHPSDGVLDMYEVDPTSAAADFPLGIAYHHMCTTRMATDPAEGVVDANCRVHGVENLYMAGSSVFATGGSATPTFTIVALALRLASHLAEEEPQS